MSDLSAYQEAMQLGHAYAWDLKWEAASRQYRIALDERPGDPSATLSLAVALERMGDLNAAREMYEEAHRLLPDHAPVLISLVEIQVRTSDQAAAATSYVKLATLYLDQGQRGRAEELLRRLVDLPDPEVHALRALRDAAERTGHEPIAAYARDKLAALPEEPEEPIAVTPAEPAAPVIESYPEEVPESLLREVPAPVQDLLEALSRPRPVGVDESEDVSSSPSAWCPLPEEMLRIPPTERTAVAVALYEASEDAAEGRATAAVDMCLSAIGLVSDYLPSQVQYARVHVSTGDVAMAEWRLRTVAELYEARSQFRQAAETWEELGALILGPDAVDARVVDLFVRAAETAEAVGVLRRAVGRCLGRGRADEAVLHLERALAITPEAVNLGLWRCRLLVGLGRPDEAQTWIDQAVESVRARGSAADPRLLLAQAILAARAGLWSPVESAFGGWRDLPRDGGSELLSEALAWGVTQGGTDILWYLAGQVMAAAGDVDASEKCYLQALTTPGAPVATVRLALARLAARHADWRSAARWLTECLDGVGPLTNFRRADEALSFLFQVAGQLDDNALRVRTLRDLLGLHPNDPTLYPVLASCLFRGGDVVGARQRLYELADLQDRLGDSVRALSAEHAAASMEPLDVSSLLRFARRCARLQFRDDAIVALQVILQAEGGSAQSAFVPEALRLLIALVDESDPRRAMRYRERLVRISPTDLDARKMLAMAHLREGRSRRALAEIRALATALAEEGSWEDAAVSFEEALHLDPWNSDLTVTTARAFMRAGQREEARTLVQRLREREPASPELHQLDVELQSLGEGV